MGLAFFAGLALVLVGPPPGSTDDGAPRRLVWGVFPGVTFGASVVPSIDLPVFLGRPLLGSRWAVGAQITLSSGGAERYRWGLVTHRYHVTGMWSAPDPRRLRLTVGGGVALLVYRPVIEVEVRIGVGLGARRRVVLGVMSRVGWNVGYGEYAPMPQLGVFVGGVGRGTPRARAGYSR